MAETKQIGKPYKFNSLKVYANNEWLFGSKKYRKVFDRSETTYIYAEFCFYNKLFDEQDWKAEVKLMCFEKIANKKRTEICSLDISTDVTLDQNLVYVREGWGNAEIGKFWSRGDYEWEAYIDGELVGSTEFFVEDVGVVSAEENPFFDLRAVRLYPGGFDWVEEDDRHYIKVFNKKETQYVWVEVEIESKVNDSWYCELMFNFFDDAHQLKGQTSSFKLINAADKDSLIKMASGWGNKTAGVTYKESLYYAEIVFMDQLIAVVPLHFGDEEVEGQVDLQGLSMASTVIGSTSNTAKQDEKSLNDLMIELDSLIGLANIKQQIREHIAYIDYIKLRKEKGFEDNDRISLHSVFTGNPGTGKTTVVKLLGKIYKAMGLLSKGHVLEVGRADVVAEFIGQTAPLVKKKISEARGGILFIDEAYALYRADDSKDFGREVIEILLKEMSEGKGDIAIMFAGYPAETEAFLTSNPGLKSRINYAFHFNDYTPDELMQIIGLHAANKGMQVSNDALVTLNKNLIEAYRNRDKTFGNARLAIGMLDEAKMNLARRLMARDDVRNLSKEELSTIEGEDVDIISKKTSLTKVQLKIDEGLLGIALNELNNLIGLQSVKDELSEMIRLVRYHNEIGKDVLNRFSLHTVFTGNPGTGKTTVARIIGNIYKALGILERGHTIEVDRSELVAGYIGQTAMKTQEVINKAIGGVLFIDEAYALGSKSFDNDFGSEAVEIILKEMEDHRGEFALIVAGYPKPMNEFLESNPGLKSRFDRTLVFPNYSAEELLAIAKIIFESDGLMMDQNTTQILEHYLAKKVQSADSSFGNAREVRKLTGLIIRKQNLRMAALPAAERTKDMIKEIIPADLEGLIDDSDSKFSRSIGFRMGGTSE